MESQYYGFVYETTNLVNGKKYVGKCKFNRKNGWKNYLGSGQYLKKAIKKYGKENFRREILFLATCDEELNELEELIIELSEAVYSKDYYNLKNTSIGGDVFTHHPRKEEIRAMRKLQFSGENNYWYGKQKPEHILVSIKEANSKKISVYGVIYDSLTQCAELLGINITTLSFRLRSDFQEHYLFVGEDGNPIQKVLKKNTNKNVKKKVLIDDIVYDSIKEASRALNVDRYHIVSGIKSGKYQKIDE